MGYDIQRFKNCGDISEEYLCPICQDVFEDAVMIITCGHIFCTTCIYAWFESIGQAENRNTCPVDRSETNGRADIRAAPSNFRNLLGKLEIKCHFEGCKEIFQLDQLSSHVGSCLFNAENLVSCTAQCGVAKMSRREFEFHDCVKFLKEKLLVSELNNQEIIFELQAKIDDEEVKRTRLKQKMEAQDKETSQIKQEMQQLTLKVEEAKKSLFRDIIKRARLSAKSPRFLMPVSKNLDSISINQLPNSMQVDAVKIIVDFLSQEENDSYIKLAFSIREELEKKIGGDWICSVGTDTYFSLTGKWIHMLVVLFDDLKVVIAKS